MITGELKSKIDRIWDAFWSGGISNPLEVIEQITYLLFIRRLDDLQTLAENRANLLARPIDDPVFTAEQDDLRWSRFKGFEPGVMFDIVNDEIFPFLRKLGVDGSTYSHHMKDARFTIPSPALLSRVDDMLDTIPMQDRDTNGDLYEYMLSKIATAGQNGQFRTPRHIIQLMVEMMAPTPTGEICDPACGSSGYLVAAGEYVRKSHPTVMTDATQRKHFHHSMFHGYDFDSTMLRIGSMNMLLHGVENPDIRYRDSLSSRTHPSPAASITSRCPRTSSGLSRPRRPNCSSSLCSCGSSSPVDAQLRRILVEDQKLDAVVKLPSGVFKPYAGVSTAIFFFTKTNSGGTDNVWFYDVQADGWSLDDNRAPLLSDAMLGPVPMLPSPVTSTSRTTFLTCSRAGLRATAMSSSANPPNSPSAFPRPTSSSRGTTSASTATKK